MLIFENFETRYNVYNNNINIGYILLGNDQVNITISHSFNYQDLLQFNNFLIELAKQIKG